MAADVFAGLTALKTAFDIAKGLKDIDDARRRNSAIIDLQQALLDAQEAQAALTETIGELKKRVADFETWDAEKQRYELKSLASAGAALAYAIKPAVHGAEPFHCICAACYQTGKKSILQFKRTILAGGRDQLLECPACKAEVHSEGWPPQAGR